MLSSHFLVSCRREMYPFVFDSQGYVKQVTNALVPRSQGDSLRAAHREWYFTGECIDYRWPSEVCDLCSHDGLRYRFNIRNQHTEEELWVGSKCILNFNVAVQNENTGELLTEGHAHMYLEYKKRQARVRLALEVLCDRNPTNKYYDCALTYFERWGCLSPKLAPIVLRGLNVCYIDHNPTDFTVEVNGERQVDDLLNMDPQKIGLIWPALSEEAKFVYQMEYPTWH